MSTNESKDKPRDHKTSSEKAPELCLAQAKLLVLRFKAGTTSARKSEVAGLLAQAIAKLETLGEAR